MEQEEERESLKKSFFFVRIHNNKKVTLHLYRMVEIFFSIILLLLKNQNEKTLQPSTKYIYSKNRK